MEKTRNYAPYLFAAFVPFFTAVTNKLLFKSGLLLNWILLSIVFLALWRLIEKLLTLTEQNNKVVQWLTVLLGSNLFITAYICLDYYVMQLQMAFGAFTPTDIYLKLNVVTIVETIYIESVKWSKAREKVQIEHLKLQAENIEAKFQLLKEQVNPEFLFYSLNTLQAMVKADDPNTEGYILKLANVYRQTLTQDKNVVSLREELDLLQNYMLLIRYGREGAIAFEMEVADEALRANLPIFSLQLLSDACIKQTVFSENEPLSIRVFQKDAKSITFSFNSLAGKTTALNSLDIEHLIMRYELEGIENGVLIAQEGNTYLTTLKLF